MGRSDRLHLRLTETQKTLYERAAKRDGFFHNGEPNVSAWVRFLADHAVEHPPKRRNR